MNGSAKKLMAVIMVTAMIASAMVIVFTDEQDSSAAPIETSTYYYDQLELDFSKSVYDAINDRYETDDNNIVRTDYSVTGFSVTINVSPTERTTIKDRAESDSYYLSKMINKGVIAAVYDNPMVGFYISVSSPAINPEPALDYSTVSFTINKISSFTTINSYRTTLESTVSSYAGGVSGTVPSKITIIHDHVADTLSYDRANMNVEEDPVSSEIRSVYTAICGSHNVVCEGYAKMFKVLCDACDIPCLIVTGKADVEEPKGNHMWNYVKIDDCWYLVDCTWDDQQDGPVGAIVDTYLLAGSGTEGFDDSSDNPVKVGVSHDPCGMDTGLKIDQTSEVLSALKYGEGGTQYLVTFLYEPDGMEPDKIYVKQYVKEGGTVIMPDDPEDSIGHHFFGWYVHDSDTEFDFGTTITADTTVDGKWTSVDVYTLRYDTIGGTVIQATRVEATDNVTKITVTEPKKEGFKFKEWNTAKDGKGMSYKGGEEITLVGDCTLYAIWEDTSSVTFKIDSTINKAAEFLSKESIPGVSNLLLTIGVITTVVSLIAVLAIARK